MSARFPPARLFRVRKRSAISHKDSTGLNGVDELERNILYFLYYLLPCIIFKGTYYNIIQSNKFD